MTVRLATVITAEGLRLHVRGREGYVDVGEATGDERLADLNAVLAGGAEALDACAASATRRGASVAEAEFGPAVPSPPASCASGSTTSSTRSRAAGRRRRGRRRSSAARTRWPRPTATSSSPH